MCVPELLSRRSYLICGVFGYPMNLPEGTTLLVNGREMNKASKLLATAQLAIVIVSLTTSPASAEAGYQPTPGNLQARQEFQDAKFGMFIHWGVYSVLGAGEWIFHDRKLTVPEYDRLPKFFDPEKFDAKAWVALAKAAGMKCITITPRHHDGFAMFDSKVSDWNIVERTPYGKDPLRMLADECHRQGIKLFFYYSQLDCTTRTTTARQDSIRSRPLG